METLWTADAIASKAEDLSGLFKQLVCFCFSSLDGRSHLRDTQLSSDGSRTHDGMAGGGAFALMVVQSFSQVISLHEDASFSLPSMRNNT